MCPPDGDPFDLDGVAALVWDTLDEATSIDELADDLAAVFDQPLADVRSDTSKLLEGLVALGVVEVR